MRKKSQTVPSVTMTATVEKLNHEGRGIARYGSDSKVVFLDNALPGETVEFVFSKLHSRYSEGRVTQVIVPSPHRSVPPCPHFTICGGCSLQHLDSATQIELKQNTLLEQFHHFGQIQPEELLPPLTVSSLGYRRKARLGVRFVEKKQRLLIGFREKQGRFLADLHECKILDPRVGTLITPLNQLISALSVYREIAQIEVAIGDNHVALVLRNLKPLTTEDETLIAEFAKQHTVSIYLQPGGIDTVQPLFPKEKTDLFYTLPELGVKIYFSPTDFIQVNQEINQKMIKLTMELLDLSQQDKVLDLFCGLGNFSLALAKKAARVVGIEGDENMVKRAAENAQRNNIGNVSFFAENLFEPIVSKPWFSEQFTKMLLDPPRSGALEIVTHIHTWFNTGSNTGSPHRIVYVSCNPATLARDAGILVKEHGYRLKKAGVMDMFPHTAHVESIAVFEK